jgi:hypothetical protein
MRRLVVAALLVASVLAVAPLAAQAGLAKSVDYTLTGSSTWNAIDYPSSFAISGDVVDGKRTVGTYAGTLTASAFGPCADPNNPYGPICASVTGDAVTFALHGGTITATVEGGTVYQAYPTPSHDTYVFDATLTVIDGTHAYASAAGTLALHYETNRNNLAPDPVTLAPCRTVDILSCPIIDTGTVVGTITR